MRPQNRSLSRRGTKKIHPALGIMPYVAKFCSHSLAMLTFWYDWKFIERDIKHNTILPSIKRYTIIDPHTKLQRMFQQTNQQHTIAIHRKQLHKIYLANQKQPSIITLHTRQPYTISLINHITAYHLSHKPCKQSRKHVPLLSWTSNRVSLLLWTK